MNTNEKIIIALNWSCFLIFTNTNLIGFEELNAINEPINTRWVAVVKFRRYIHTSFNFC